jgi:chemotaxis protein methyltransferase CheR
MTDLHSLADQMSAAVSERVGLKAALSGPKIEALLRAMPEGDRADYCRRVLQEGWEGATFRAFVEALLVHETYFFRHPDQLRVLADDLLPRLVEARQRAGSGELAVWCAGCSTGEEVYTIALLAQAALARATEAGKDLRFSVLGTDLSGHALAQARRADYARVPGLNSFRDVPDFARHHFSGIFTKAEGTWAPTAEIRRCARFLQHNLVSDPPPETGFDVILCRNTLIYFDDGGARRALRSLEASLRPGGVLLLGPAEMPRDDSRLAMRITEHAVFWTKPSDASP